MTLLRPQHGDIPLPYPSVTSQRFWEGCQRGELLFQRCQRCGAANHTPTVICGSCWSQELSWERSAGNGTIYSWTMVWRPQTPAFVVPYAPIIVEMDEGWQILSCLMGCSHELTRWVSQSPLSSVGFRRRSSCRISVPCSFSAAGICRWRTGVVGHRMEEGQVGPPHGRQRQQFGLPLEPAAVAGALGAHCRSDLREVGRAMRHVPTIRLAPSSRPCAVCRAELSLSCGSWSYFSVTPETLLTWPVGSSRWRWECLNQELTNGWT